MTKILNEAQNYEEMFNLMRPYLSMEGTEAIDEAIRWARQVLRRKDRIVWFMRHFRTAAIHSRDMLVWSEMSSDVVQRLRKLAEPYDDNYSMRDMKILQNALTHYMGIAQNVPAIANLVFSNQPLQALLDQMQEMEREWQKTRDEQVEDQEGDEVILSFPDGFAWVNLHRSECSLEGDAMGHCGNAYGNHTDTILSLRKRMPNGQSRPSLTFIMSRDGELGEMKGRANNKPAKQYHPYIIALLKQPFIKGIVGGGHDPANNFQMADLTKEQREQLFVEKPSLMDALGLWMKYGAKESDLIDRKLRREFDSIDDVPNFEGLDDIGEDCLFVIRQGADHWYEYLVDHGDSSISEAIQYLEDGPDSIETYSGWVWNLMSDFPQRLQNRIVQYVMSEEGEEVRESLGLDDDDELSDEQIAGYLEENDAPFDIMEAFEMAYSDGHRDGAAEEIIRRLEDCRQELHHIAYCQRPDGKWVEYIDPLTICRMSAETPDDLPTWGEDETLSIDEPHNGWEGFSKKGALSAFLEHCPEEVQLEPVELKPLAGMSRQDMLVDLTAMRGLPPAEIKKRYADYDDNPLRSVVRHARKSYYGFEDSDPITESYQTRVHALMEGEQLSYLHDVASVRVNDPDADFWIIRRGSREQVGKPVREYSPEAYGIKVQRPDVVLPDYLFYAMTFIHAQGYWSQVASGSLRLVNITARDVRNVKLTQR